MVWTEHPAIAYSILKWFDGRTSTYSNQHEKYSEYVRVRVSGVTNRPAKWVAWNCGKDTKTFVEKKQAGSLPAVFQGLSRSITWSMI